MIVKILDRADDVLVEGRQSVQDLREEGARGDEFSAALESYGKELVEGSTVDYSFTMVGSKVAYPDRPAVYIMLN